MDYCKHYQKLTASLFVLCLTFSSSGTAQNAYSYAAAKGKANQKARLYSTVQTTSSERQTLLTVLKELNRIKGVYFLFS